MDHIDIVFYNNTVEDNINNIIESIDCNLLTQYIHTFNLSFDSIYLEYSFISSNDMIKLNIDSLNHDYDTDIISFNLSNDDDNLFGNFYLSHNKILENSKEYNILFTNELYRVIIHGFLHLIGFNDITDLEKDTMRDEENKFLNYIKTNVPRGTI